MERINKRKVASVLSAVMMISILATGTAFAADPVAPDKLTNITDSSEEVTNYTDAEAPSVDDAYTGTTKSTDVEVSQSATFKVIIPKKITLDGRRGQKNEAEYTVTVVADIPGDQVVNVVPDKSFKMSTAGKDDITATVTQDVTEWSVALDTQEALAADKGVAKAGKVEVANLSSGSWTGQFNFDISITDDSGANV